MDWLGQRLGFTHLEDWYPVTLKHFTANRGTGLLHRFSDSPMAALKDYRPDHEWLEWRFRKVPGRFWQQRINRRRYLKWLGQQLGFRQQKDWYQLTRHHLEARHGRRLLSLFKSSPLAIMQDCFPQQQWLEWRFCQVPGRFWRNPRNRHRCMNWLGKQLRIRRLEDWYQVSPQQFRKCDGGGLLAWFEESPSAVLKDYRPHYPWLEWRFSQVPAGFWDARTNRARYLGWLGHQLGFCRIEDWYTISYDDITQRHGARLLQKFGDSPIAVVRDYHPTYDWREWLFRRPPRRFWANRQNRRRYLDWLGEQLGFAHPDDWQRLRVVDISTHRGQGLLKRFRYQLPRIVREYLTHR